MSRRVNRPVDVRVNEGGEPLAFIDCSHDNRFSSGDRTVPVLACLAHWREWIGILDGEPERDVWQVETSLGICELHCLHYVPNAKDGQAPHEDWLLACWMD